METVITNNKRYQMRRSLAQPSSELLILINNPAYSRVTAAVKSAAW